MDFQGASASSGTGGVRPLISHRGVDLGPQRFQTRHSITQIAPLTADQIPWQNLRVATGRERPVRYGSGARFGSRDRDPAFRRARSQPFFGPSDVNADPAGPQTRQEWLDAPNSFQSRLESLERLQGRHSHLLSKTDENLIEKNDRLNTLANSISGNQDKTEQVRLHLEEACTNISKKYATINATELAIAQVIGQLDNLRSELMEKLNHHPQPSAEREIPFHQIHTPPGEAPTANPGQCQEPPHIEQVFGDAYAPGPDGQPVWNSKLPQPAHPGQSGKPQSPLRSGDQPYVAPPAMAEHPRAMNDGLTDHAGLLNSSPGMAPPPGGGHRCAPPTSWTRPQGAPTPPWQGGDGGAQHHQHYRSNYQQFQSPQDRGYNGGGGFPPRGPAGPEFQGHNRVQYMGNREAMDKKSESLKKYSGNPAEFVNWANRFIDHMGRVHWDWKNTLQWLSSTPENLSYARLSNEVMGPWSESACDLARKLEQTIMDYMPEKVYNRRQQLCGGPTQKDNGFIL